MAVGIYLIVELFTTQPLVLMTLRKKPFENIVGKEGNAGNQHFLLFPQCFLTHTKTNCFILASPKLSSANAFNFDMSTNLLCGKS